MLFIMDSLVRVPALDSCLGRASFPGTMLAGITRSLTTIARSPAVGQSRPFEEGLDVPGRLSIDSTTVWRGMYVRDAKIKEFDSNSKLERPVRWQWQGFSFPARPLEPK